jgi:hypothetical protein
MHFSRGCRSLSEFPLKDAVINRLTGWISGTENSGVHGFPGNAERIFKQPLTASFHIPCNLPFTIAMEFEPVQRTQLKKRRQIP